MLLYAHILHEQLKQQKKRQDLFSISPPDSDFVDPHDGIGSGRKKRKEEKKRNRPYLLLDMGQGPYVVGSQKRRKAARKRPHRCHIHIHQIKSHISTRFFLVQMAPRFVEPTYGIPGCILVPIKPVPSSQHAIVADARFSSPLLPPIKHSCELSSPFTEHSRLSLMPYQHRHVHQ